jgi:hypothetical protein
MAEVAICSSIEWRPEPVQQPEKLRMADGIVVKLLLPLGNHVTAVDLLEMRRQSSRRRD